MNSRFDITYGGSGGIRSCYLMTFAIRMLIHRLTRGSVDRWIIPV
jgi:hypothetical protein